MSCHLLPPSSAYCRLSHCSISLPPLHCTALYYTYTFPQVFKVLALNCLVTAYMMSALYLRGLKQGDMQMTFSGLITAGLFFFLSQVTTHPFQDSYNVSCPLTCRLSAPFSYPTTSSPAFSCCQLLPLYFINTVASGHTHIVDC